MVLLPLLLLLLLQKLLLLLTLETGRQGLLVFGIAQPLVRGLSGWPSSINLGFHLGSWGCGRRRNLFRWLRGLLWWLRRLRWASIKAAAAGTATAASTH